MINNNNFLELMSNFLEKAHRKISDSDIYKKKISFQSFNETKKLLGVKFYNTEKLNTSNSRLLLDYVLVEADMNIINRPFNLIFNQNTKRYEPCLVILFAALEIKGKVFPVDFSFWISENMTEDDEFYLTKSDLAELMIIKLSNKFNISEIIFDAGFCVPNLLEKVNNLGVNYICRFPKSRKIIQNNKQIKASKIFKNSNNNTFYYYHNNGYMNCATGFYSNHDVQLVVVANTKEKLHSKDFYCLLTNNLEIKYPSVLKRYKSRGKIEDLFKKLKTYLGLTACNRHNEDYMVDRINLSITGFVIIQDYASKTRTTFHKALKKIKASNHDKIKNIVKLSSEKMFLYQENTAFQNIKTS